MRAVLVSLPLHAIHTNFVLGVNHLLFSGVRALFCDQVQIWQNAWPLCMWYDVISLYILNW